ncbi:hypothetical protein Trydic_g2478 [Trypoxylus dichotomus]
MIQKIYVKECLQKRVLLMIHLHKDSVLFCPDLATCRYGKLAQKNGVNVVLNPPYQHLYVHRPDRTTVDEPWAREGMGMQIKAGVSCWFADASKNSRGIGFWKEKEPGGEAISLGISPSTF